MRAIATKHLASLAAPARGRRKRLIPACAAAAAAALIGGPAAQQANAVQEVIYDLRVVGGPTADGKSATVSVGAPTINLALFAYVLDLNGSAADTGFSAAQGAWTSTAGGLRGNFTTALSAPFNDFSSQNPAPSDLDGDGDLDVGNVATASSGFWIASNTSGSFSNVGTESIGGQTYRAFRLGTGTFSLTSFSGGTTTQLNFVPRNGDALVKPHKYFKDSTGQLTSINGNDPLGRLGVANAINITLAGDNYTWTRSGGDGKWDNASNWSIPAVPNASRDSVTFGDAGAGMVDLNGNKTVGAVAFTNSGGPYSFHPGTQPGSQLILNNGTGVGTITQTGSGSVVFNPGMGISGNTINVQSDNNLGLLTISGPVNATTVNKNGVGTLALGGGAGGVANYRINAGALRLTAPQAVQTSTLTLNGGTLELRANASTDFARPVVVTADSTIWTSLNSTGPADGTHSLGSLTIGGRMLTVSGADGYDVAFNGPVSLTAPATFNVVNAGSDLRFAGVVSGNAGIVKTGAQTLVMEGSQPNTYTGATFVNGGVISLAKPAGVNAIGGNVTVNNSGTLLWQNSEQIPDSATLTLNAGGNLNLNGFTETVAQFVDTGGNVQLNGGQIVITGGDLVLNDGTTVASDVSLGRDLIYSGTTTTAQVTGNIALANNNVNHTFNVANGAAAADVAISGVISGATNIVKTGAGTLQFDGSAANTYFGATTVSAGTLTLARIGAQSIVGPLEVNGAGVVRINSADQIGDGTPVVLNGGGVFDLAGQFEFIGSLGGAGGTIQLGNGDLNVNQSNAATFGGVVAGNGTLNKYGLAALTLAGANTFTGSLSVNQGTLRVASDANLAAAGVVFIYPGGTLATSGSFTTAKTLYLGEPTGGLAPSAVDVAAGTTFTATGHVGQGGHLLKLGPGTLLITGSSDFTAMATMHIDQGTVAFAGDRTLWANHSMIVNANGTLDLSASALPQRTLSLSGSGSVILGSNKLTVAPASGSPTFAGQMTGAGSFAFDGPTSLTLGGSVNIGGQLEVSSGTVAVSGAASVAVNNVEVISGASAATLDIAGAVAAASDVLLQGTAPGGPVVNLQAGGSLTAGGSIVLGDFTQGIATLNVPAGATVSAAANLFVLNGSTVNLSGGTIIAGGFSGDPESWETGFNWTAGTLRITESLSMADGNGELGPHYTVGANRTLEAADLALAGPSASLTITGGGTLRSLPSTNGARIGVSSNGVANVHITGAGSTWTLEPGVALAIRGDGAGGLGQLEIDNGGSVLALGGNIVVSASQGGAAALAVIGGGLTTAGSVIVATGGAGSSAASLNVGAGGEVNIGGALSTVGRGKVGVNGGSLTADALTMDAGLAAGPVAVSVQNGAVASVGAGGVTTAGGDIDLVRHPTTPGRLLLGGDFTYNGTTQHAAISSTGGASDLVGVVDLLGGQRTFDIGPGADANADLIIDAAIVNGGITKTGAGTLALFAAADYAGPTDIQQGELLVQFGALPASSPVIVASGAALRLTHDQTLASLAGGGAVFFNGTTLTLGDQGDSAFNGTLDGAAGATPIGKLIKQGTGTLDIGSDITGVDGITVNLGTLRLSGTNNALAGVVNVTGTGPTQGTLALASENLGSASLNLAGGRVRYEGSATVTRPITLGVGGGTFETVSVVNLDTALGGTGGLTKTGPGTLALMQAATYDGATNIMEGTLQSFVANAIPTASEVFIETGATLALGNHSQALASISGGGAITVGGANVTVGGNDATTLFGGSITGSGSFSKVGTGELTLSGALALNGLTTVHAGTLVISGNNTSSGGINVASGAAVSVGAAGKLGAASNEVTLGNGGTLRATGTFTSLNPIQLATGGGTINVPDAAHTLTHNGTLFGATLLTKSGAGTLRLETNKVSLSGALHVTGGTLSLGGDARLDLLNDLSAFAGATVELDNSDPAHNLPDRVNDAAMVTLGGGTLALRGGAGGMTESINELHVAPGQSTIDAVSGPATLNVLNALVRDPGGALHFNATGAGGGQKLLIAGMPDGPVGAWATVSFGPETRFAKYNAGEGLVPLANTDYSPTFDPNANVRMENAVHNVEPVTIRTLTMSGSILSIDPGRTLTIETGGVIFNGQASTMNGPVGGTGNLTSGSGALHVRVDGNPSVISARLSGTMDLIKSGPGTLDLGNNTNDFAGNIHLNAGALRISDDRQLGVAGDNPAVPNGNDIAFNGGTLWANPTAGDLAIAAERTLMFNASGGHLRADGAHTISLDHDNQFAGAGTITKDGTGTLRVRGANGYAGPVSVAGGRLELGNVAALGTPGADRSIITLAPGTFLDLRSDGPFPANFGNDVRVLDNTDATAATITTGAKTDGTPGEFQLNDLRMGKATLNTSGLGGSLAFTGIVTLAGGEARVNTGRDLVFADRVTGPGALTKLGAGTLTLGNGVNDTAANTYAGVTNIAGGVLELNKAAGTVAIPGDIVMSGGTLVLRQPRQISDNSRMLLTGGTFDLGGQSDSIQRLDNAGANVIVNGATLTVGQTRHSAGTITIGAPENVPAPGGPPPANDTAVVSAMVSDVYRVDGANALTIVNPGASLQVGSTGLFFEGGGPRQITLVNSTTQPGKLLLRGNVTVQTSGTTGTIASSTATPLLGVVDMGDIARTYFVNDDATLVVNAKLTRGGLRLDSSPARTPGKLVLTAASDYTLGATVAAGTLEAHDGALGSGTVTLSGGNLNLRSNAALARFGNDVTASSTTINIDRISGSTAAGTFQFGKLTIGASTLRAEGGNGGALEFTGAVTLTGQSLPNSGSTVIQNFVPVTFSNAITGTGKIQKDGGPATLTFTGPAANTYTGTTRINAGKLLLNKPAGVTAIAGNVEAFTGGQVEWQNHDQVADTAALSVNSVNAAPTRMDLKDFRDTVASVDLSAGTITTGTAGLLRITGGITSYPNANPATISGNIDLPAGMHIVNTTNVPKPTPQVPNPTPQANTAAEDLVISANISGLGGITKTGPETLVLSGTNSFTGGLVVQGGTLKNIGTTQFTGNAALDVGTTLDLPGNFNTAPGAIVTKSGVGALNIGGAQSHGAGAQLVVQQGALNMNSDAGTASTRTLAINANGGSVQFGNTQHLASLHVGNGVTATVTPGGSKVIVTDAFSAAGTGSLNLNDAAMVVTNGAAGGFDGAAYTGLTKRIADAYNFGAWDGVGVKTTMPDAQPDRGIATIAIATPEEIFGADGVIKGQTVSATSVILAYTYAGDVNLDGVVDGADYGTLDNWIQFPGSFGYAKGDVNYDGVIDGADYGSLDNSIQLQGAPIPLLTVSMGAAGELATRTTTTFATSGSLGGVSAVPEPSAGGLAIAAAAAGMLGRRRRRRSADRVG